VAGRIRHLAAALALAGCVLAFAPPGAFAAASYVDGISDQNIPRWNGGVWNGGPPRSPFARFLRTALIASPTAPLRYARYVVAYDVMCDPLGPDALDFRAWLADVRSLGLTPVVAFWYGSFHGNRCPGLPAVPRTVAQYNDPARGVAAFLRAFRTVTIVEAWNEPNDGSGPDVPAARAAGFWLAAGPIDCGAGVCDTVLAGDFSDAQSNLVAYEHAYVAALGGLDPLNWAVHPYKAVNDLETATVSRFEDGLPDRAADRVWYTEVGAYYCTPSDAALAPAALAQRQDAAAHFLVATLMAPPFAPVHVFYYELMYRDNLPPACAVRDSSLFGLAGTPGSPLFAQRPAAADVLPAVAPLADPLASVDAGLVPNAVADWAAGL
jgi:hypothetical protein